MTERPILFSGPMVRAILDGRKTQTRRVVKWPKWVSCVDTAAYWLRRHAPGLALYVDGIVRKKFRCPYGQPGDRLWVREAWLDARLEIPGAAKGEVWYRADESSRFAVECEPPNERPRWRPSIHLPRWASRITLEVTAVRVERVQDITEADAIAEGCMYAGRGDDWQRPDSFSVLWDAINGPRGAGWDANPWVWVVEFRRIEK